MDGANYNPSICMLVLNTVVGKTHLCVVLQWCLKERNGPIILHLNVEWNDDSNGVGVRVKGFNVILFRTVKV